jgi:hypothetical protein
MWPIRTTDQKEESMDTVSQDVIIGIDVSRDWLDIYCLPEGRYERFPNTDVGHQCLAELAGRLGAVVCFEATGHVADLFRSFKSIFCHKGDKEWQVYTVKNSNAMRFVLH